MLLLDGALVLVGVPEHNHPSPQVALPIFRRKAIAGSMIGGIAEAQEMLDFCAEHGIVLGALGAKVGNAPISRSVMRVVFWGALAMAITAGVGHIFGVTA